MLRAQKRGPCKTRRHLDFFNNDANALNNYDLTFADTNIPVTITPAQLTIDIDNIEGLDLTNALSALALAQQDIIELKSKVESLELTSFLILE